MRFLIDSWQPSLPLKVSPGGMIRPMDLAMAIRATAIKEKSGIRAPRRGGVKRVHVTLRAQPWIGHLQQSIVDRPMRIMAVGAVFKRRWMRPEKWTPSLGVAGVTIFIDARLFELCRIRRAVRVMAAGTCHLAFAQWHMGRAHKLCVAL
jgi:hypothetical protein